MNGHIASLLKQIGHEYKKVREAQGFEFPAGRDDAYILTDEETYTVSQAVHLIRHWGAEKGAHPALYQHPQLSQDVSILVQQTAVVAFCLGVLHSSGHEALAMELVQGTGCPEEVTFEQWRESRG